ncbi:hypothetical protein ISN44_As02g014720 [Arabidopsis suecica]|uniref:Plant thionin family protein n=1 Tax=Arabidopsis suecica TaxID=45249 RepID=A0A8T2G439_ARASU|nr:hypothetical protein ISN44_As02g014720 [Arabidopsis suecica]
MAKWSAIVLIMMVMIVAVTIEAQEESGSTICFRQCSQPCRSDDGSCYENCKIECGGPKPPLSRLRSSHA